MVDKDSTRIRVAVVIGSARADNYTEKVVAMIVSDLESHPDVSVDVINPRELKLFAPGQDGAGDASLLKERIDGATAVVLATPEYHGSFSAIMKLIRTWAR